MIYQLRDYQQAAADAGIRYFLNGSKGQGALMVLPTGSGKSLVIAEIARQLSSPIVIFQPTKEILEQNYQKYVNYGLPASIFSASVGFKRIGKVTFATIGSAIHRLDAFRGFPNIIIDECHGVNAKGGMYLKFVKEVGDRVLGLTATPYRLVTDGYGGSILKFLTRTRPRVFYWVIHVTQNQDLFERGYLARLEYSSVEGFDSERLRLNTTGADYTDESVKRYYQEIDFTDTLSQAVVHCLNRGRKSILVFTRFVDESQALANRLLGIAEIVTAKTCKKNREGIIARFRSGRTKVVTNVGVLTTGFDFPELETIIIARPTMSLALYYQMIGRGIRPHPDKDSMWAIDLCDNYRKFGRVEDLQIVAPRPHLWHIESKGKQLTNIYFGDRGMATSFHTSTTTADSRHLEGGR